MAMNLPSVGAGGRDHELDTIGRRMLDAMSAMRMSSLSLHDERGDVLWLNDGVMGPDEHEAVRASLEAFAGEDTGSRYEHDLGDGRVAIALRASQGGSLFGLALCVVDGKALATPQSRGRAEALIQGLAPPLAALAAWLEVDVSATQTRIQAMAVPIDERSLEGDVLAARPTEPLTAEPPSRSADAPTPPARDVDRHLAALRAIPLVLYTQRLEPMQPGSRIRRYEILLRTDSEHGRTQAPVAMLEAAVKRGLGSLIDVRVITELATWLDRHRAAWRTDPILCSVNLSPSALADDRFVQFLERYLTKARLPRGMLAFELDANRCAQHLERAGHLGRILAAFGCTLIIDDFTLRDSLLELLALKGLGMLKLHADLTTGISADKRRQAIVAGIAQIARMLGVHTCAKRIETRTDQRWLAALKIDFAQGFAFAEPLPIESLLDPTAQPALLPRT